MLPTMITYRKSGTGSQMSYVERCLEVVRQDVDYTRMKMILFEA